MLLFGADAVLRAPSGPGALTDLVRTFSTGVAGDTIRQLRLTKETRFMFDVVTDSVPRSSLLSSLPC